MPKNLGKIASTPTEDIEIAGMGIALKALLNRQSQALHAAATCTGTRRGPAEATVARRARRRHVNTKLVAMPCRRAISVTTAPGASVSSMIRILSSRDQRRRRSTPPELL